MLKPFLPPTPSTGSPSPAASRLPSKRKPAKKSRRPKSMRSFLTSQFHLLVYTIVHTIFSIWFRFRHAWHAVYYRFFALLYYHHRTPEYIQKDVKNLGSLPGHLSVILELNESDDEQGNAGLEGLVNDVCEISAWCACAGIPLLSVYEKTGILKNCIPQTHRSISETLESYFGVDRKPALSLRAPHLQSFSPPTTPPSISYPSSPTATTATTEPPRITVLLLSATDGRNTMVDLTKTLAEMAQKKALDPADISADLIDIELKEAVSGEPDLLVLFSPRVELKGYPPWQVRLTEIFHVPDNAGVNYQVFVRALHKYAKAQMRFGR